VTLAGLLGLPLLAQPLRHSRTALCFENLRALMTASFAYGADHEDRIPQNQGRFQDTNEWCGPGYLNLPADLENVDAGRTVMRGSLSPYLHGNAASFRCPEDPTGRSLPDGAFLPRVRSYSMNSFMGNTSGWYSSPRNWRTFTRFGDLPNPGGLWILIEERPDSINDGNFPIDMSGFPSSPGRYIMVDYPSFYHGRGGTIAFGDGHVETRAWQDPRTMPTFVANRLLPLVVPSPGNPDLAWLFARSSVPK